MSYRIFNHDDDYEDCLINWKKNQSIPSSIGLELHQKKNKVQGLSWCAWNVIYGQKYFLSSIREVYLRQKEKINAAIFFWK